MRVERSKVAGRRRGLGPRREADRGISRRRRPTRPRLVLFASNAAQTLRKLYATPWKPWTLVETLDNKLGAISRKTLKWRRDVLPS